MSTDPELLRVVRGEPTPEELAVLTALASVAAATANDSPSDRRGIWSDPGARLRRPLRPGPGGWRAASLPGG